MKHTTPKGAEYRNAAAALLIAFRMLFVNELAARRAFRIALERRGRTRTLLTLLNAPETFAPVMPDVEVRTVELVDGAAREFAACHAARPRALFREAADMLRRGYMLDLGQKDRERARKDLAAAQDKLKDLEERREWVPTARERLTAKVSTIFKDPADQVVERIIAFGATYGVYNAHGAPHLWIDAYERPELFGRLQRAYLKGWMDSVKECFVWLYWFNIMVWPLRYTTSEAEHSIIDFRSRAIELVEAIQRDPSDEELQAARERVAAATAALDACAAEDEEERDTYRACRLAAPILFDAMRRLNPAQPAEAAPQVKRQLGRMLPSGAHFFVSHAVELACKQADAERRYGGGQGGRDRSRDFRP